MPRTVSTAGRAAIMQREGCELVAYQDSVGVWTIGVGHTGRMSPPLVTPGMRITRAQADTFLMSDSAPVEKAIADHVTVSLSPGEFDALASLIFNIGVNGFQGSTVLRKLNKGDRAGAADAFLMWNKPAVLKTRREAERAQFLAGSHDVGQIASAPDQPVLNAIIGRVNQAAYDSAPLPMKPPTPLVPSPGPIALPAAAPSLWSRFASLFTRKAA